MLPTSKSCNSASDYGGTSGALIDVAFILGAASLSIIIDLHVRIGCALSSGRSIRTIDFGSTEFKLWQLKETEGVGV